MEGGRFDFNDGGSYVGEWLDGRAHGLGVASGPEKQGEYSGEWTMGFESRGVYIWPSGNIYSGTWLKGKRHGEGVQVKGRWIYRGAFTTGFCGRYGVKESLTSCAKYEGSWHLNQFDGFGVETNSDGSVYAGAWSKGMRQGLGVRRSAPYALAAEFNRAVRAAQSQNSIPSGTDSERGWRGTGSIGGGSGGDMHAIGDRGRLDERRSGFVLRSASFPSATYPGRSVTSRFHNGSGSVERKSFFKRGLFRKLRKQKSTGDLSVVGAHAYGGFTSSSVCGGGSLFHSRGRRAGGSLRSTLSGASQVTTNSFGRMEVKSLGNGGQGLHEVMDEPLSPGVTETYSGQWNEDRRSGYGIAERSDGLKYVGEWFNNKKDGYGVSYYLDGTKEEGKYKENVLIQQLNRKSKLFVLRHSKLRDAIEEAAKNAEDASKKAQESASEAAYQRAQTARMVANTADARARDAKKLSDEARIVAKEFSPDFEQLGLVWEKKNPLLKKELFGETKSPEDVGQNLTTQRNMHMDRTMNGDGPTGNSLEVSGGSRQGSFRSSFRRRGDNPKSYESNSGNQVASDKVHGAYQVNASDYSGGYPNWSSKQNLGSMDHMTASKHDACSPHQSNAPTQRSPAGRPMARAATTGVSSSAYSQTDQKQMLQHMAQHPHSPYLMASTSQHLDERAECAQLTNYGSMPRNRDQYKSATSTLHGPNSPEVGHYANTSEETQTANAQLSKARAYRAAEIALAQATLVSPGEVHRAELEVPQQASVSSAAQAVDKQSLQHPQPQQQQAQNGPTDAGALSWAKEIPKLVTPESTSQIRRRTLPSIMTQPPVQMTRRPPPKWINKVSRGTGCPGEVCLVSRAGVLDEDAIHSAENLPSQAADTYIIENGIRKRVQAVTRQQQRRLPATQRLPEEEEGEGRRPEWTTAYDPYRPGMESTVFVPGLGDPPEYSEFGPGLHTPQPLPRTYRIDSEVSLLGTARKTSVPDLPSACVPATALHPHRGTRPEGLTREEVALLTHARRLELMEEMERRRRGEIVIRLADIKDWVRANFVIVFVLLINASLAFLFFNLLTRSTETDGRNADQSPRAAHAPSGSNPPPTMQLAKSVLTKALKKVKSHKLLDTDESR